MNKLEEKNNYQDVTFAHGRMLNSKGEVAVSISKNVGHLGYTAWGCNKKYKDIVLDQDINKAILFKDYNAFIKILVEKGIEKELDSNLSIFTGLLFSNLEIVWVKKYTKFKINVTSEDIEEVELFDNNKWHKSF